MKLFMTSSHRVYFFFWKNIDQLYVFLNTGGGGGGYFINETGKNQNETFVFTKSSIKNKKAC